MREKLFFLILLLAALMFSIDAPCKRGGISQQAYWSRVPMFGQKLFQQQQPAKDTLQGKNTERENQK